MERKEDINDIEFGELVDHVTDYFLSELDSGWITTLEDWFLYPECDPPWHETPGIYFADLKIPTMFRFIESSGYEPARQQLWDIADRVHKCATKELPWGLPANAYPAEGPWLYNILNDVVRRAVVMNAASRGVFIATMARSLRIAPSTD